MSADCRHYSVRIKGQHICRHCDWIWIIDIYGARWIAPPVKKGQEK